MAELEIVARPRQQVGTAASRRLRRQGWLPASLYGVVGSVSVQVPQRDLERLLRQEGARTRLWRLRLAADGQDAPQGEYQVLVKELQVHPVTRRWLHVDFYVVPQDRPVRVRVPVVLYGVEQLQARGAVPAVHLREIEVECLPAQIPAHVELDVSHLEAGDHLTAGQIRLPEGVQLHSDPDETVVSVVGSRAGAEEPAPAAPGPAEPERIVRRRATEAEA